MHLDKKCSYNSTAFSFVTSILSRKFEWSRKCLLKPQGHTFENTIDIYFNGVNF